MTMIESNERKAILLGGKIEYAQRLIDGLGGNPQEWDYTGDCIEDSSCQGICACGHEGLRFNFILKNRQSGITKAVGSTCICHYVLISPEVAERMAVSYQNIMEKLALAKKEAKKAKDEKEVKDLIIQFNATREKAQEIYQSYRSAGKRAPYDLWAICDSRRYYIPMDGAEIIFKYKRACDMKRKLKDEMSYIKRQIEKAGGVR